MVSAIGQTNYNHIPCIAQCLQLSILQGLKVSGSATLLAICRQLVENFKHIQTESKTFIVSSSTCDAIFHKLQPGVATSWNSTYIMLAR